MEGYHERLLQALIDYASLGYRNWSYYEYLGLITLPIFFTIDLSIFFSTFDQQIAMISFAQDSFSEVLHSGLKFWYAQTCCDNEFVTKPIYYDKAMTNR